MWKVQYAFDIWKGGSNTTHPYWYRITEYSWRQINLKLLEVVLLKNYAVSNTDFRVHIRYSTPFREQLLPIILKEDSSITKLLTYFMGKNTSDRQEFIINNLRNETDISETADAVDKESADKTADKDQVEKAA